MRRREFITLLGGAAAALVTARAQSAGMLRVGMVAAQPKSSPPHEAFLQGLAELGYQQGKNLTFEFIQATFGSELREQPYDYETALAQAPSDYRVWLFVMTSPFLFRDRARLAEFALRHRAASVFAFREWVDAGGLLSYGPSINGMYRRAAGYVDRIARGAKPSDLPIEQPTKFEFVLNLKTAKEIGLATPTALLLRADEVIE